MASALRLTEVHGQMNFGDLKIMSKCLLIMFYSNDGYPFFFQIIVPLSMILHPEIRLLGASQSPAFNMCI